MKTIIAAGDNLSDCAKLNNIINIEGHSVISFCGGNGEIPAGKNHSLLLYYLSDLSEGWKEKLNSVKNISIATPMIVISETDSSEAAVFVMKNGAVDFIFAGLPDDEIKSRIEESFDKKNLISRVEEIHELIHYTEIFKGIIGRSSALRNVFSRVEKAMKRDVSVLILGESGTGKELFARAIHEGSGRSGGPFVTVNCAAITPDLAESLLFGHVKGSFTGSVSQHRGYFSQANGGSIFLDEIGDMNREVQGMVLRVLEDRKVRPLGALQEETLNIRIISATNRNLRKLAEEGNFREDLYYRLDEFPVTLPPLRERREDIPLMADHFLKEFCMFYEIEPMKFGENSMEQLKNYSWPGNVRELKNIVRREAVESIDTVIESISLPDIKASTENAEHKTPTAEVQIKEPAEIIPLALLEEMEIKKAFRITGGNADQTAFLLGLSRATLYRKLKSYGML